MVRRCGIALLHWKWTIPNWKLDAMRCQSWCPNGKRQLQKRPLAQCSGNLGDLLEKDELKIGHHHDPALSRWATIFRKKCHNFSPEYRIWAKLDLGIRAFHAVFHGIPVIAAGGNIGSDSNIITNSSPWLITVVASNSDSDIVTPLTFENNKIKLCYVGAPGVNILAVVFHSIGDNGFQIISGTSMATPHVATFTRDNICWCRGHHQYLISVNMESKVFAKIGTGLDVKNLRAHGGVGWGAILGEDDFGLVVIYGLPRKLIEDSEDFHNSFTILGISFGNESEVISKDSSGPLEDILIGFQFLALTSASMPLDSLFMHNIKRYRDRRSPCLMPLEGLKKVNLEDHVSPFPSHSLKVSDIFLDDNRLVIFPPIEEETGLGWANNDLEKGLNSINNDLSNNFVGGVA
ncbi:hypothetical protein FXO37_33075 [Capsicum annuum]|nr:hypothetical protein FXO37_33075 [Capsicum annuum]